MKLPLRAKNFVIATSTASGKTLCYNLPVVQTLLDQPSTCALYLFPTKALAQDQLNNLNDLLENSSSELVASIYDGDTPQAKRAYLRGASQIILSNPDMLHTGILPHHTVWKKFFSNLRYVIIDEMHTYRGVFGSHITNVLRRLKRIANFYGAHPQFIFTSATIANPQDLGQKLIEQPVFVIDQDGSPNGQRNFLIYSPPIIDEQLGIRKSSLQEGSFLANQLIRNQLQTIIFGRSRRMVELILTNLRNQNPDLPLDALRGYRSGYLRDERREVERGLRDGSVRAVAATSALELGIDIGDLDAAVIIGFPGSIAATRQQAGRAGRRNKPSLAVLITSANPMDQYLSQHPEYFFDRSPEQALIDPDNLLILLAHIRCAAFELPFTLGETFGSLDPQMLQAYLEYLANGGDLDARDDHFYWVADKYPAGDISLRSASPDVISLVLANASFLPQTIGQVDRASAFWMVHPEAVYIHEAQPYYVEDLDLDKGIAHLKQVTLDYFTEPRRETTIEAFEVKKQDEIEGGTKFFGNLTILDQVTGYRRLRWFSQEQLGGGKVDLPPTRLETVGYWFGISQTVVEKLRAEFNWNADANDYGHQWAAIRSQVLERDGHRCRSCGISSLIQPLHVHHLQPFRTFTSMATANALNNLISLCPTCHRLAEQSIRIRSGLSGLAYLLRNLAPLLLMCDFGDLGVLSEVTSPLADGQPAVIVYDNIPGGIGLCDGLYTLQHPLFLEAFQTISTCQCKDGCPACVGPIGEEGYGGKQETIALLEALI